MNKTLVALPLLALVLVGAATATHTSVEYNAPPVDVPFTTTACIDPPATVVNPASETTPSGHVVDPAEVSVNPPEECKTVNGTVVYDAPPVQVPIPHEDPQPPSGQFYAASSPWNTRLTGGEAIDPNSAGMVSAMLANATGGSIISWKSYGIAAFEAPPGTPRYTVRNTSVNAGWRLPGVPVPAGARPAAGSDAHLSIIDNDPASPTYRCEYGMWAAGRNAAGNFDTSDPRAGIIQRQSLVSDSGWVPGASTRGSSAMNLGGVVRPSELRDGVISHALNLYLPTASVRGGNPYLPSYTSDGTATGANTIPESARLRLNPSTDLSSLQPHWRVIGQALKDYGAFVIDRSGSSIDINALDNTAAGSLDYGIAYPWGTTTYPAIPSLLINNLQVLALGSQVAETYSQIANHACGNAVAP